MILYGDCHPIQWWGFAIQYDIIGDDHNRTLLQAEAEETPTETASTGGGVQVPCVCLVRELTTFHEGC